MLTLAAVISGYAFLAPGHPTALDVWPHLARQKMVYQSLKDGSSPFYSFMFYSGYPHLRFYGPLFAFLGGLLTLATGGNVLPALKILLFILHLISAWVMYLYLKHRTGGICSAALGSVVYLLIPWRVLGFATEANYPQTLIYLLLPLLFLAFERVAEKPNLRDSVLLGLWFGLAIVSHILFAGLTVAFLVIAFLFSIRTQARGTRNRALALPGAALLGVALSAFFLIPFLAEYQSFLFPQLGFRVPMPDPKVLLFPWSEPGGYAGIYLGLSNVILIVASVVVILLFRVRRMHNAPALVGLGLSLVLAFVAPRLQLTQGLPPVRFLLFFVFFGAVLVSSGYSWLDKKLGLSPTRRTLVFLGIFAVICLDCLPHLLRVRYSTKEKFLPVRQEVYDLISQKNPNKVLDLYNHENRVDDYPRLAVYPAIGFLFGNLPGPLGPPFHQFAPRSMLYVYPLVNLVATDLGDSTSRHLDPASLKALALLGISHLITLPTLVGSDEHGAYVVTKQGVDWDDRFLKADRKPPLIFGSTHASLVLASNVIKPAATEKLDRSRTLYFAEDWYGLLSAVEIDVAKNRLSFIPVTENQAYESLPGQPALAVLESNVENHQVSIKLQASHDCFLRLALSYYPDLRILLDTKPVRFHETKDHFIYLRCPAGTHELSVTAPLNLLRRLMLALSAVALAVSLLVLVVSFRRKR